MAKIATLSADQARALRRAAHHGEVVWTEPRGAANTAFETRGRPGHSGVSLRTLRSLERRQLMSMGLGPVARSYAFTLTKDGAGAIGLDPDEWGEYVPNDEMGG